LHGAQRFFFAAVDMKVVALESARIALNAERREVANARRRRRNWWPSMEDLLE
jgi:hypothetical protein